MTRIGIQLDLTGLKGPLPTDRIEEALRDLPPGSALKVVATDPRSVADMASFVRRTGHEILDQSEGGGEVVFLIMPDMRGLR